MAQAKYTRPGQGTENTQKRKSAKAPSQRRPREKGRFPQRRKGKNSNYHVRGDENRHPLPAKAWAYLFLG